MEVEEFTDEEISLADKIRLDKETAKFEWFIMTLHSTPNRRSGLSQRIESSFLLS